MEIGENCLENKHRKKHYSPWLLDAITFSNKLTYIQKVFLLHINNNRNFTGSEIAIINTPHQVCAY